MTQYIRRSSEDLEQEVVMQWVHMNTGKWPELALLHHIPNGGARSSREGAKLKRMGVLAGVADLRDGHAGNGADPAARVIPGAAGYGRDGDDSRLCVLCGRQREVQGDALQGGERRMKIIRSQREFTGAASVVALGMFDGVHIGHQALIRRAVADRKSVV